MKLKTKKPKEPKKKKQEGVIKVSGSYKKKPKKQKQKHIPISTTCCAPVPSDVGNIPKEPKPKQKQNNMPLIFCIVIIFALLGYIFYDDFFPENEEKVMQCIADNSQLFATTTCPYCIQQKEMLGEEYLPLFNITYCDLNPEPCVERGIQTVPFWIINTNGSEQGILGIVPVEDLKELTGC